MPCGPAGRVDGDDGHAGGEVPHDGAEAIGLDGSHLTISVPYMPSSSWLESAQKKRYSPLRTLNVVLSRSPGSRLEILATMASLRSTRNVWARRPRLVSSTFRRPGRARIVCGW